MVLYKNRLISENKENTSLLNLILKKQNKNFKGRNMW